MPTQEENKQEEEPVKDGDSETKEREGVDEERRVEKKHRKGSTKSLKYVIFLINF